MGLDFSNSEAHWSYSGFSHFRTLLAKAAGIDLSKMEGYDSGSRGISWDTIGDPIRDFLDHSDCDGELTPEQCRIIAPRLRELVKLAFSPDDYNYEEGILLAEDLEYCAREGITMEFC